MFRSFFNRRFYKSASFILVVFLLSSISERNLSLTRRHIQRCAVDVTEKSYYQLDVDGKPAAYFSNYTDSTFVDGSLPGDSIRSRMSVTEGYQSEGSEVASGIDVRIDEDGYKVSGFTVQAQ